VSRRGEYRAPHWGRSVRVITAPKADYWATTPSASRDLVAMHLVGRDAAPSTLVSPASPVFLGRRIVKPAAGSTPGHTGSSRGATVFTLAETLEHRGKKGGWSLEKVQRWSLAESAFRTTFDA
jgi:hypothetical protein